MSKMTQSIVTVKREVRLEEWKRQVAACVGSGLSVRQWCAQEGIAPGTYYNRLRRVRECVLENEIVPVSLQEPARSSGKIEITTEQMKISLPSGKTKLAAAVQYVLNEKKYLYAFLEDPSIPVDNNTAERAVKPFVIGRKNWLFSASPEGAEASAIAYSVIQTALANNLNARDYLTQVFAGKGITKLPLSFYSVCGCNFLHLWYNYLTKSEFTGDNKMPEQLMDLLKLAYRQKAAVYAVGDFFGSFFNDFSLKKIFAGFMVILEMFGSVVFDAPVTPRGDELDLTGYNLVFEDEFNGDSLNYTKWEHWREGVYGPGYLADSQVEVKDGALTLSAEYLENGKFGPGWYAADIQLKEKYKCGYFEIKCICNSGPDFWSAFWIQADHPYEHEISNGGIGGAELDIVESISSYQSSPFLKNAVTQTVHCNGGDDDVENIDSRNLGKFKGKNIHEEYNTYGLEWTDSEYIFYVNGVETRRTSFSKGVSQVEETVRVSMCTPPVDEITLPLDFKTEFKVDYVKIYQKSDNT